MLTNMNHQATRPPGPGDSSDPTQHPTPLHRRPYWNQTSAAFSAALWLPAGNHRPRLAHQYSTRLDQQHRGPFMVLNEPHRGPQPKPAQTLFDSRCAGHDRAHHRRRHQATSSPDTGLSRPHPEARYRHLADRQPLDLQPHRRDPAVWHPGRMETHRQHGNAGSRSATSRMGFGPLPGEAHGSQRRLPRHEQRQDLQLGTQVPARHRATEPTKQFAQLGYRSRKNPKQSCYIPDDAVTEHGVYHTILGPLRMAEAIPAGQQGMPTGAGARPLLARRSLPGAIRH